MEIVINNCFGGFGLSYEGVMKYAELKGIKLYAFVEKRPLANWEDPEKIVRDIDYHNPKFKAYNKTENNEKILLIHYSTKPLKNGEYEKGSYFSDKDIPRDDPALIQTVKELGEKVNTIFSDLKIVEIPDGTDWIIDEYDGSEHIAENHNTWS